MFLPAYLLTSGLGSKLSRWLVPPTMKSQMTRFAFGAKWALPSGGDQGSAESTTVGALAYPSRWSIAARARPVKPMPRSARKARRGKRRQLQSGGGLMGRLVIPGFRAFPRRRHGLKPVPLKAPPWHGFSTRVHPFPPLPDRNEVVVVQQHVDEVFLRALDRVF